MRRLAPLLIAFGLCLAGTACQPQATAPVATDSLGFRLIVDNGATTVTGRVLVPASMASGVKAYRAQALPTLADVPKAGITVDLVDPSGVALNVTPVKTSATGLFTLQGVKVGEAAFVRAKFTASDGQVHCLYSYVRPKAAVACMEVSLASTLLAQRISKDPALVAAFNPDRMNELLAEIKAALPSALEALAKARGLDLSKPGDLEKLLLELTKPSALPALNGGGTGGSTKTILDELNGILLNQVPGLEQDLNDAVDTSLVVDFTIQAVGKNKAPFSGQKNARYQMSGDSEIFWEVPQDELEGCVFLLNEDEVAQGEFKDGAWRAKIDSRKFENGAYLLQTVGERADGKSWVMRAFVYIDNASASVATASTGCGSAP